MLIEKSCVPLLKIVLSERLLPNLESHQAQRMREREQFWHASLIFFEEKASIYHRIVERRRPQQRRINERAMSTFSTGTNAKRMNDE
jgi:hypothetical protein